MSFNVLPFGSTPGSGKDPGFAEVVDLASRRQEEIGTSEFPDHVWDEVEAASRLWHDLRADDREVRFDTDAQTGGVVASLCDLDGGVVRPLPLRGTFGLDDHRPDGPSAA